MKVGHRQAPNKRKPDSKESGFFAFGAIHITCPIHPPGRLGRAERNPTRVSELQVSKGKVELFDCLVQSHPQQQPSQEALQCRIQTFTNTFMAEAIPTSKLYLEPSLEEGAAPNTSTARLIADG